MTKPAEEQILTDNCRDARSVPLSTIEPGASVRVVDVDASGRVGRRLQEMGLVPGVEIRVVKTAPFGDPFELRLLGYKLAIRRSEAAHVLVMPV
ncbi:MAG: ferrous iron transport protein A [Chloracidobacterium sp.]|nr:ferrous iron transport protein A [Chloracidobacterium sp.]